jgi:hypothetical protein
LMHAVLTWPYAYASSQDCGKAVRLRCRLVPHLMTLWLARLLRWGLHTTLSCTCHSFLLAIVRVRPCHSCPSRCNAFSADSRLWQAPVRVGGLQQLAFAHTPHVTMQARCLQPAPGCGPATSLKVQRCHPARAQCIRSTRPPAGLQLVRAVAQDTEEPPESPFVLQARHCYLTCHAGN